MTNVKEAPPPKKKKKTRVRREKNQQIKEFRVLRGNIRASGFEKKAIEQQVREMKWKPD